MAATLLIKEHASHSYAPRTYENASKMNCDLTIAFAAEFHTAGERCTMTAAGRNYMSVPLNWNVERAAGHIRRTMYEKNARRLNIAGNGIYTLSKHAIDQVELNEKIYNIIKEVLKHRPIDVIRSGGQTGVDHAGLVAAHALGIYAIGLYPKGYRRRGEDNVDFCSNPQDILLEIREHAGRLNPMVLEEPDGKCHCHENHRP